MAGGTSCRNRRTAGRISHPVTPALRKALLAEYPVFPDRRSCGGAFCPEAGAEIDYRVLRPGWW